MAPKKTGVKKLKAVAGAAAATKRSPDKLRAKVAAAKEAEQEDGEDEEPDLDHLLSFFNKKEEPAKEEEPTTEEEPSATPATTPAPEPAAAAETSEAKQPAAQEATSSSSSTAAGSALNAKRLLDSGGGTSSTQEVPTVTGGDALAEALGLVSGKSAAASAAGAPSPSAAATTASPPSAPVSSAPVPSAPVPDDAALLEALKKARKKVADQHKLMTNMVCPTEVLEAVTRVKPTTPAALAEVEDFGPTRAERYGEPLLECIRAHVAAVVAARGDVGSGSSVHGAGAAAEGPGPSAKGNAAAAADAGGGGGGGGGGGHVTVRYNHYSEQFALTADGKLDFRLVDDQYALSYVFKGSPRFSLRPAAANGSGGGGGGGGGGSGSGGSGGGGGAEKALLPDGGKLSFEPTPSGQRAAVGTFSGLAAGGEYVVEVEEDPKEKAKAAAAGGSKAYISSKGGGASGFGRAVGGGTRGSALVTAELKKMSAAELKEAGPKYRALLEARDLEDAMGETEVDSAILGEDSSGCSCIWGNPCAMPHACKDWKARFEVAKKHGWKGF